MKRPGHQDGISLIEVLISLVIIAIGLLGMAQLQTKLQTADLDAYQRAIALSVIDDISSRMTVNRASPASYLIDPVAPLGTGRSCPSELLDRSQIDLHEWCRSLQGIAEIDGGQETGSMTGARGCIEATPGGDFLITVTWQGLGPVAAPPASVTCASGLYDKENTECQNDLCRRYLTTVVRIADLS